MVDPSDVSITRLLHDVEQGKEGGVEALLEAVYAELHAMARAKMARIPVDHSLQPTVLVHDAYLKIFGGVPPTLSNRKRFFMVAARAMRNILVDQARHHARLKRGGDRKRVDIDQLSLVATTPPEQIVALNDAIERLDPELRQIVELRFFAELTMEETARALDMSLRTLERQWRYIRARLHRDLSSPGTE